MPQAVRTFKDGMNYSTIQIGGRKALLILAGVLTLFAASAGAQSRSGQLTITMSVQSSISLVFNNNPAVGTAGFCPLLNAGTNNVGLDMGIAAHSGNLHAACVNYTHLSNSTYQVSTAFDVLVSKSNTSSPNYRMSAEISIAPPANVAWLINNVNLTNTGFTQLDTAATYGAANTKTLQVQVQSKVPAQVLFETITFLATAN
ncbi:MAG TPA: hypothetical protein VGN44_03140 [Candidatus Angelobacter sp.]